MKYKLITSAVLSLLFAGAMHADDSVKNDSAFLPKESGSSVSYISGEELRQGPSWNLLAILQGRVPGLVVSNTKTTPSEESFSFLVRGKSSMNGNTPLVVIDGMLGADLGSVNVRDIESVTILKDAAATVLYGMRGANGVIAIKTKRGAQGKPLINVSMDYTIQQPIIKPDFVNSFQYASLMNEAAKNDGYGDNYYYSSNELEQFRTGNDRLAYPDQNWYDRFVKDFVHTQLVNVSASGGNRRMSYYANVAYQHQGSPFETEETARYDNELYADTYHYRTNVDVNVNDYLDIYMNLSGKIRRKRDTNSERAAIYSSIFDLNPTMNGPLTENGQIVTIPTISDPTYGRINRSGYVQNTNSSLNVQLGADLDMRLLLPGLRAKVNIGYYTVSNNNILAQHDYERWIRNTENKDEVEFIKYGNKENTALSLTKNSSNTYVSDINGSLEYQKTIGKHRVETMLFMRTQNYSKAAGFTEQSDILPSIYMTYGGSADYSFNNIFAANFSFTYDGSEQFARENRYHFFPSGSVAWILTNQEFMEAVKSIDRLKIRASVGKVGNDAMGTGKYPYLDIIKNGGSGSGFVSELGGVVNEQYKGNIGICPETSTVYNWGVEVGFLKDWNLTVDLFREKRTKILVSANTTPSLSGWSAAKLSPENAGEVRNQGLEITLGYNKQFTPDLFVSATGYVTYYKNEIKKANEIVYPEDYAYRTRLTGFELDTRWGYEVDYSNGNGFFNSAEEIAQSKLVYEGAQPRVGDLKFVDRNKDGVIDPKDQVPFDYTGTPNLNWGVNLNAQYRKFDLSVFLQGAEMSGKTYSGCGFYESYNNGTFFKRHLSAWTPERYANGEKILAPALSTQSTTSHRANSFYNRNTGYFRLKNVEIGYTFPLARKGDKKCRIYLSAHNVLSLNHLKSEDQMDPEAGFTDYPLSRYFNLGINLKF